MKWSNLPVIFLCSILCNCKKDNTPVPDTNILTYSIQNSQAEISIVSSEHLINIRFPDGVMNADSLIANFTLSPGCSASIKNIAQVSGVSKNNYSNTFVYTVSASGNSSDWKVIATNNNYTAVQGFGNFLQQIASNNCTYLWYKEQAYTGIYTGVNAGPAAVTMACKWSDSTFSKTVEDARNAYRPTGGDWYPDDITFYLKDNSIPNSTFALPSTEEGTVQTLKRQVDLQQIVIVYLEIYSVRYNSDPISHIDRFYLTNPGYGHFIIIKGYKKVDNEIYFEVYDPNSMTKTYSDGSLMGKDRYYRSKDLFEATKNWWPKIFLVAKKGATVIE